LFQTHAAAVSALALLCASLILAPAAGVAAPAAAQAGPQPGVRITLGDAAPRQGDIIVATIAAPRSTTELSVTAFDATWPAVAIAEGRWRTLIGVDLDTKPGRYRIAAASGAAPAATAARTITVQPRKFRVRTLRVAPEYVNPPPDLLRRITSDSTLLQEVFANGASEASWTGGFRPPVPGRANSSFGTRSVFNGEARNPHGGTDFLSPAGTPVHAPASGRVAVARDLFFTGNTVVIDHGSGVFSTLAHLSRVDVTEGATLERGDVVGLVGATGRVTGPHLHWSLRIGSARVDPLSALASLPAR
jgi:murein DD-endopeptidase MepM/ murein hydrolase activator NlpD